MIDIEQNDRLIEYNNKIRKVAISGQNHAAYILENPERANAKLKELNDLRDQIALENMDKSYKESFFQSINSSLNYFKGIPKNSYNFTDSLLLICVGIFLGIAGMHVFDGAVKKIGENFSQTLERKVYEKLEGGLNG